MSVQGDLVRAANDVLTKAGLSKSGIVAIRDGVDYGQIIPEPEVVALLNLTRQHNQWLNAITVQTRGRRAGRIKYRQMDGYMLEYVEGDEERSVTNRPATGHVDYITKKHKAEIVFDMDDLDEYMAAGEGNFEQSVMQDFYTQLGNNMADIVMNADASLGDGTRATRALRSQDGVDLQTDAANVLNCNGAPFDPDVFIAMRDQLPMEWRNLPGMRYWVNDRIITAWQNSLMARATSLGDAAIMSNELKSQFLQSAVLNPYIKDTQGPTAIAPTSVTNNTTYLTVNLATLVTAGNPATVDAGVGRNFLVTLKANGKTQLCRGRKSGTDLLIDTTNLLGQVGTPSTTASDYEVRPADETSIYYGDPKTINLIWTREMRSYREYNKNVDRIEVVVWFRFAIVVPEPILPGIVKYKQIALPPIKWPKAA